MWVRDSANINDLGLGRGALVSRIAVQRTGAPLSCKQPLEGYEATRFNLSKLDADIHGLIHGYRFNQSGFADATVKRDTSYSCHIYLASETRTGQEAEGPQTEQEGTCEQVQAV